MHRIVLVAWIVGLPALASAQQPWGSDERFARAAWICRHFDLPPISPLHAECVAQIGPIEHLLRLPARDLRAINHRCGPMRRPNWRASLDEPNRDEDCHVPMPPG